jgi:hypothetical protein
MNDRPCPAPYTFNDVYAILDAAVRSLSVRHSPTNDLLRAGAIESLTHHLSHPELRASDLPADPAEGALTAFLRACAPDAYLAGWARDLVRDSGLDIDVCLARLPVEVPYGHPMSALANSPEDYELLRVADLPAPHSIKRDCALQPHFDALSKQEQRRNRLRTLLGRPAPGIALQVRAGQLWQHEVVRDRAWSGCGKHQPDVDWNACIDDVSHVLAAAIDGAFPWRRDIVYRKVNPSGQEPLTPSARLTWSLLGDPIHWSPPEPTVVSGQHRLCGARAAGVERIWVRVR